MKVKVQKGTVTKELDNKSLVADYVSAGWKIVQDVKTKTNPIDAKGN